MNDNDKHIIWLTQILDRHKDVKEAHISNLNDPYLRSHADTCQIKCEQHKIAALQFAIQTIKDQQKIV